VAVKVMAPIAGAVTTLAEVPDPVFAEALVGPGLAIRPDEVAQVAVAPVAGQLVKVKPHAYVVQEEGGRAVLVHLGIDTVTLKGDGFKVLVIEGQHVAAGDPIISWDPSGIARKGLSPMCPVVALDAGAEAITDAASGHLAAGDALFTWA
jgi:sugar PTS system EIIA component